MHHQMGQLGPRRNFPRRQMGGGGMGTGTSGNGQAISMRISDLECFKFKMSAGIENLAENYFQICLFCIFVSFHPR
jgi:hypothetical protein